MILVILGWLFDLKSDAQLSSIAFALQYFFQVQNHD